MKSTKTPRAIPKAVSVQLNRLFGPESSEARCSTRSDAQWRKTVIAVLGEIDRYRRANIHTDAVHALMLDSGLLAAHLAAKKEEFFWPSVVEGLVRFALTLMGEYPDHRRRKGRAKGGEYYSLQLHRTVVVSQTPEQKYRLLWVASELGLFGMPHPMWQAVAPYHDQYGYKRSKAHFLEWFKQAYPEQYSRIF